MSVPAALRRMAGRLRSSAFFFLRGLHRGSESTRIAYRISIYGRYASRIP